MKLYLLIFTFLICSGCVSHADSVADNGKTAQPTPTVANVNSNANNRGLYSDYQYDSALIAKLSAENERFRIAPDEFKSIDFKNFKYDFGRLKDGEYEDSEPDNPSAGGQTYTFEDVFFVDLTGDAKKEAVVLLYRVSCGGSCDGGAELIYFYSSNGGKAKLLDVLETGSNSGGCSLESLMIKNKKLYVEQFGRCRERSTHDSSSGFVCKFCVKDETHSTYSIADNKLLRDSIEILDTETLNIMNSPAYISIND